MYFFIHSFTDLFVYLLFSFYSSPVLHVRVGEIYLEFLCYYSVHVLLILFDFVHNLISF